ncbi:SUMF1/EgtB/PvdO family nonheme iron enzyme [Magnetococcus sp. PR-3]|uniref:SUMF1/EgtB/PvdO family nonheme iron enzyme n=1 Tax=Magnetococcus sp. PR-3 TaxID=3120355 RepID=UPI002FCE3EA9
MKDQPNQGLSRTHPLLKHRVGQGGVRPAMARRIQKEAPAKESRWGGMRLMVGSILFIVAMAAGLTLLRQDGPKTTEQAQLPSPSPSADNRQGRPQAKAVVIQKGPVSHCGTPEWKFKRKTMMVIPSGAHRITGVESSHEAVRVLKAQSLDSVNLESEVWMMPLEVSIQQFKRYVDYVQKMKDRAARQSKLDQIGLLWNRTDPKAKVGGVYARGENQPVRGVAHDTAAAYAQWMADQSGCRVRLPTREEWAAAVMDRFNALAQVNNPAEDELRLESLLRGVREWSGSSCAMGYHLLGQDDWTGVQHMGGTVCMPASLSVAGFRLIIEP